LSHTSLSIQINTTGSPTTFSVGAAAQPEERVAAPVVEGTIPAAEASAANEEEEEQVSAVDESQDLADQTAGFDSSLVMNLCYRSKAGQVRGHVGVGSHM
jgi:hypothetical protein